MIAPEVAAFLRAQPRALPYSELAAACAARFGTGTAPDADAIRRWWFAEAKPSPKSRLARDPEVCAAILDLAGRRTGPEIIQALQGQFGPARLPSRSALYRFLDDQRRKALAGPTPPAIASAPGKPVEGG